MRQVFSGRSKPFEYSSHIEVRFGNSRITLKNTDMKELILSVIARIWKLVNRSSRNNNKFNGTIKLPEMEYFGVADWQKFYRVSLTPRQIMAIGDFPWSENLLNSPCPWNPGKTIRETHFAFMGFDTISIMKLQELNPQGKDPCFYVYAPDVWYIKEKFPHRVLRLRWYLLLREIIPNSEEKTFNTQKMILPKEYEVPSAAVEAAKNFLIYKKEGIYVNEKRYARTSDVNSGHRHIVIGCCNAEIDGAYIDGVYVRFRENVDQIPDVGIGASRKLP